MKNLTLLLLILPLVLFSCPALKAQIKFSAELFNKIWQVDFDEDQYIKNMSPDEWNSFKSLTTSQRHTLITSMSHEASMTTFEFKMDGNFTVRKSGEILEEGVWELQSDGKTIIARNSTGFEDVIELIELGANRVVLNSKEYGQELVLVPIEK